MSTQPLDLQVRELLGNRKGDWQEVAKASGVSYSWLSKFFNGHIEKPGFATLTKVRDTLDRRGSPKASDQQHGA